MGQICPLEVPPSIVLDINLNMLPRFQVLSMFLLKQMFPSTQADKGIEPERGHKAPINQDWRIFQIKMIFQSTCLSIFLCKIV